MKKSIAVVTGLVLILAGIGFFLLGRNNDTRISNVLLISIDTCRADYLSCYGFDRLTTPQIDEIARQGMLFQRVQTPVPITLPAHCSMLTGLYPPTHHVRENIGYKLNDSCLTLAEILRQQGYDTAGIVSAIVMDRQFGLNQGFNSYLDEFEPPQRTARDTAELAREFLDDHQGKPFFLFLHYYDPHEPYEPPEPYASQYADNLYAGEIAYTDYCIGRVMDKLKELDLYDSTLILIVSDHGEGLGEHNELLHAYYVYQSTIHVPFVIKGPGVAAGVVYQDTVSLVDIVPTIMGSLNLPLPENMQGKDLSDHFSGYIEPQTSRLVYIESLLPTKYGCHPLFGVVDQNWSYIRTRTPELYDLDQDPGELINVAGQQKQRLRFMETQLQDQISQINLADDNDNQLQLDADTRKHLESLGYIGSIIVVEGFEMDLSQKNPKEMIACHECIEEATSLLLGNKFQEAKDVCFKLTSQWPQVPLVYPILMRIGLATNDYELILQQGPKYFELIPEDVFETKNIDTSSMVEVLATNYSIMTRAAQQLQRHDVTVEYAEKYLNLRPDSSAAAPIRNALAQAYFKLGRHEQALQMWNMILRAEPARADIYQQIGVSFYEIEDLDRTESNLTKALDINPNLAQARQILDSLPALRHLNESVAQLSNLLQKNPNDHDVHGKLAYAYFQKGNHTQAVHHWRQAIRLQPDWPEPYNNLAGLLANTTNPNLKNPVEAVRLAQKAADLTQNQQVEILLTLTMAHTAAKQYPQALEIAQKALKLAQNDGNKTLADSIQRQIDSLKTKINDHS